MWHGFPAQPVAMTGSFLVPKLRLGNTRLRSSGFDGLRERERSEASRTCAPKLELGCEGNGHGYRLRREAMPPSFALFASVCSDSSVFLLLLDRRSAIGPGSDLFVGTGGTEDGGVVEAPADDLQADG